MRLRFLAITIVICLFSSKIAVLSAALDEELGPAEIVEKMVTAEETNNELARKYEYEQETVTEKLNGDGKVVSSKNKTTKQQLQPKISYKVQGIKGGKEVETEVGFGSAPKKGDSDEDGTYLEAMTIRELSRYYDFVRGDNEAIEGVNHYVLNFKPKDAKDIPKAKSREEKVLANLAGKLWIHPTDFSIVKSDSRLVSPLPFAIIDLVSLRDLHISYEASKLENKVWVPKQMEIAYQVRILYFQMIRERQKVAMRNYVLATETPAKP